MYGLAQLIRERTSSNSPIEFIPYDQAYAPGFEDMARRVPSVEKLQRLTGFRPTTSLSVIVERVLEHTAEEKKIAATEVAQTAA